MLTNNQQNYIIEQIDMIKNLVEYLNDQIKKHCKENKLRVCPGVNDRLVFVRSLKRDK